MEIIMKFQHSTDWSLKFIGKNGKGCLHRLHIAKTKVQSRELQTPNEKKHITKRITYLRYNDRPKVTNDPKPFKSRIRVNAHRSRSTTALDLATHVTMEPWNMGRDYRLCNEVLCTCWPYSKEELELGHQMQSATRLKITMQNYMRLFQENIPGFIATTEWPSPSPHLISPLWGMVITRDSRPMSALSNPNSVEHCRH